MRCVAIIQARMGSSRLPGKSMMMLSGKPLAQNVIERVCRATRLDSVWTAIPFSDMHDEKFAKAIRAAGSQVYVETRHGIAENDLVGRYLGAAEQAEADLIVRICADNPCIEPEYIDKAIERYLSGCYLFYTNTTALLDYRWVDGVGAEVFSLSRLKLLDQLTQGRPDWREHPHKWFYDNLDEVYDPSGGHALRLDINTQADYDFIKGIFDHFGNNTFHVRDVLEYLKTMGGSNG